MSKIDIARLKIDADYWLESDPYAGKSTHYCTAIDFWLDLDVNPNHAVDDCCIPRPVKKEWNGGLPRMAIMVNPHEAPLHYGDDHLGEEIEVIEHLPDESCYVVRFDWGLGVLHESMIDFGLYDKKFNENRLKNELARVIRDSDDLAYSFRPDDIAEAVIKFFEERYNLEEK